MKDAFVNVYGGQAMAAAWKAAGALNGRSKVAVAPICSSTHSSIATYPFILSLVLLFRAGCFAKLLGSGSGVPGGQLAQLSDAIRRF